LRAFHVTGVQTCALPICLKGNSGHPAEHTAVYPIVTTLSFERLKFCFYFTDRFRIEVKLCILVIFRVVLVSHCGTVAPGYFRSRYLISKRKGKAKIHPA